MILFQRVGILAIITSFIMLQPVSAKDAWNIEDEKNGVAIYSRNVNHSDIDETKGVTIIDASIEVIAEVLKDISAMPEWMPNLKKIKVIENINQNNKVLYSVIDFPWPIADRDAVIRSLVTVDPHTGAIVISSQSLTDASIPETNERIRVKTLHRKFLLEFVEREKTRVTITVFIDPHWTMPVQPFNAGTRQSVYKTLINLKEMVLKEKYVEAARNTNILAKENREILNQILAARIGRIINDKQIIQQILSDDELVKEIVHRKVSTEMELAGIILNRRLKNYIKDSGIADQVLKDNHLIKQILSTRNATDLDIAKMILKNQMVKSIQNIETVDQILNDDKLVRRIIDSKDSIAEIRKIINPAMADKN